MNPTTLLLRRRGLLATSALAALLNLAAVPAALAAGNLVRVEVLDRDNGDTLRVWRDHRGGAVVAGRPGARYAVRLINTTGERVLAVVAIDGVNVVTGETASAAQRGYVLDPWQRAEITGWRKSNDEVAAFEFTSLSDSYAARTGRPLDVGVIGVAAFREAPRGEVSEARPEPPPRPSPRDGLAGASKATPPMSPSYDTATAASAAPEERSVADSARASGRVQAAPQPSERLGTGHGARETSVVRLTDFERASSQPDQRLSIRYDSVENLAAAGIVPPPRLADRGPHAFPADPGYVPDPPRR